MEDEKLIRPEIESNEEERLENSLRRNILDKQK